MKEQLEKVKEEALRQIESSEALEKLNDIRVFYLGKKGGLTNLLRDMKDAVPEDRPKVGQMTNNVRRLIERRPEKTKATLAKKAREEQLKREVINVTLPARKNSVGYNRPDTVALEEVERIFVSIGYGVVERPEVGYDRYNFEKLNIPRGHPTRDEQDTFYIDENILLRSQTSPIQVHTTEQGKPSVRMIAPDRMFRSDEADAIYPSSSHQTEGLVVGKSITFAGLKGILAEFARELFGPKTEVKFRPRRFPFTGPSAEVDATCFRCGGSGCRFCKGSGQTEILGCGMVHPHVLEMCDIDPDAYSGFAFDVGLEHIALLKYEINDMRLLYRNDIRFLKQF